MARNKKPSVFISYSDSDAANSRWVAELAGSLAKRGIEVLFDKFLPPGSDLHLFMEGSTTADKVLVICTEAYVTSSNMRQRNVGVEASVISARLYRDLSQTNVIPLLRSGSWDTAVPTFLRSRKGFDFRSDESIAQNYELLVSCLKSKGSLPSENSHHDTSKSREPVPSGLLSPSVKSKFDPEEWRGVVIDESKINELLEQFSGQDDGEPTDYTGCIMVVDISDFSQIGNGNDHDLQKKAIAALDWYFHNRAVPKLRSALKNSSSNEIFFTNTLDGALLASATNIPAAFVQLAHEWILFMRSCPGSSFGLRVGLHSGDFLVKFSRSKKEYLHQVFGSGPNDCDRIARIGDSGDVYASDSFVRSWIKRDKESAESCIFPKWNESADIAYPKRGRPQPLRKIYRSNDGKPEKTSSYFRRKNLVDKRIRVDILPWIYDEILHHIEIYSPGSVPDGSKLGVRVSFYVPERIVDSEAGTTEKLICIARFGHGCELPKEGNQPAIKATTYLVPEGPVGTIYHEFTGIETVITIARRLPDPNKEFEEWVKAMQKYFNLPLEKISKMNFRARAFVTVPVALSVKQKKADGVLCIDFINQLTFTTDSYLRALAQFIYNDLTPTLAAHWELRTS